MKHPVLLLFFAFASFFVVYFLCPSVFIAICISLPPSFFLLVVNAERINIFSMGRLGLWCSARGNSLAMVGSMVMPGRVTEVLKPMYYRYSRSLPIAEGAAIIIVERVFDLIAVVLMALSAMLIFTGDGSFSEGVRIFVLVACFMLLVLFVVVLLWPQFTRTLIAFIPIKTIRQWSGAVFDHMQSGLKLGVRPWQILLTVFVWGGSLSVYWLFFQFDGGVALSLRESLLVFLVATLGLTLTVTPGGVGTFEAVVAGVLVSYGYQWEQALISAFGLRVIALLPNVILAAYTIYFEGFDFFKFKNESVLTSDEK